jgi:hypothetical protein
MFDSAELNSPLMRQSVTGMSDAQLATIGYISVLWNGLERNFVACIWVAADWPQDFGEIVTADLGNVGRADLLMNLIKQSIADDPRIADQAGLTIALCDQLRGVRNHLMHGFFNWRHRGLETDDKLIKFSAKARSGYAKMMMVPVDQTFLEQAVADLHLCNESFNDLTHKLHFRRLFLSGVRTPLLRNYEDSVHGWRAPSLDISLLRECLKRRSPPPKTQHNRLQRKPSPP